MDEQDSPDTPWDLSSRAEALLQQGRAAEAEALLRHGVGRFPDNPWPASVLGGLLNRQKRWGEAGPEWIRQIAAFPDHAPAYAGLADVLAATGDIQGACEAATRGVERCPGVYWLRARHADLAANAGVPPRELAALWEAVAVACPGEPEPYVERARALCSAGDPAQAWPDLERALETWPDYERLLVTAAEVLLDLGAGAEALAYWRRLPQPERYPDPLWETAWRLFAGLDGHAARREPLAFLLSEGPSESADWRPTVVVQVRALGQGPFAQRAREDIRRFITETIPPEKRTFLHRLVWALVGRELAQPQAEDNLRTSLTCDPWLANVLLEVLGRPERMPAYAAAARAVLPAAVEAELARPEPEFPAILQALKNASVFDPPTFDALLACCAKHPPGAKAHDASDPEGAVTSAVRAHRRMSAPPRRADRRLRIAVCISGQMRGFRQALSSWDALRLQDHDARYFVHTWRRIGGSPRHTANAPRVLPPRLATAYSDLLAEVGQDELRRRYPRLFGRLDVEPDGEVDGDEVRALYGADDVCIEEDRDEPFAGTSNAWKMHYKIAQAHRQARSTRISFDLYIRIRPDLRIGSTTGLDWTSVAHRCESENLVYADEGRAFQSFLGYYMGDQFAVGAQAGMDAYAGTFEFVENGGVFAAPRQHVPHASLALATFHAGVRVERTPAIGFAAPSDALTVSKPEAEALLRADLSSRRVDDIDRRLLESCRAAGGQDA